jgi:hypothetical protein
MTFNTTTADSMVSSLPAAVGSAHDDSSANEEQTLSPTDSDFQAVNMAALYHKIGVMNSTRSLDPDYVKELNDLLLETNKKASVISTCLDPDCHTNHAKALNDLFQKSGKEASDITGKFLHKLHEMKPDEEAVKKMITAFPSSLSYQNSTLSGDSRRALIPVHSAVLYRDSFPYIPLLANEGDTYKVGGDDGRGGLLVSSQVDGESTRISALQFLCFWSCDDTGMARLNVIKELRRLNLILKEDIIDHNLLLLSSSPECEMIFHYLADWDPTPLKENSIIFHIIIDFDGDEMENFTVFLKAAFRHYPEELGLLFQKHYSEGNTICECAFEKYGKDKTFRAIDEFIHLDQTTIPILHYVAQKAPNLLNDFIIYYPSAVDLRNSLGRKWYQAKLAFGNTTYRNSAAFFTGLKDCEIAEIDPGTDLPPFMVAASGQTSDLSAVYYLLRRSPFLVNY